MDKAREIIANAAFRTKPRRNPMPGSKASGLKKRMDGTVERRSGLTTRGGLWPAGNNTEHD